MREEREDVGEDEGTDRGLVVAGPSRESEADTTSGVDARGLDIVCARMSGGNIRSSY